MSPPSLPSCTLAAVTVLLGCGEEPGPPAAPVPPSANVLKILSGNGQSGLPGRDLPQPLVVQIVSASGSVATGVPVAWTVTSGGGNVSSTSTATDALGQASTVWTLGLALGTQAVTATAGGAQGSPASFTATARAAPVVIQRYDGLSWHPELADSNGAFITLSSVWGSSPTDVFAVGHSCSGGVVLHYNGTGWGTAPPPGCGGFLVNLWYYTVWGTSAADVFVVGRSVLPPSSHGFVDHYDGQQWMRLYDHGCSFCAQPRVVWSTSAAGAYLAGDSGLILHYDGASWQHQASGTNQTLSAIWGTSASDIFAVGGGGTILHSDGSAWRAHNSGTTKLLTSVQGASASDVFAVGEGGTILHYDGATWTPQSSGTTQTLYGIWVGSQRQGFAVGAGSTILHYDGMSWTAQASGAPMLLLGVWGSSPSNVLTVGEPP